MWWWQGRRVQRADEYFYSNSLFPGAAANPLRVSRSSRGPRDLHRDSAVNTTSPAACLTAAAGADSAVTSTTSPAACLTATAGADPAVNPTSPAACITAAAGAGPAASLTPPGACLMATADAAGLRAISGCGGLPLLPTLPTPTPSRC